MNVRLIVAYDGSDFFGWQENGAGPSVEGTLRAVLERILQHPVSLQVASRTDAGVHAEGQVVNFILPKPYSLKRLHRGVNALLPKTIRLFAIDPMHDSFHPTSDAIGKEYEYRICFAETASPFTRRFAWHYPRPLDADAMREGAGALIGRHDFTAFANVSDNTLRMPYCTLTRFVIEENLPDKTLCFTLRADRFLYKMVRNLVGTLVGVGAGEVASDRMVTLLLSRDRREIGVTAPAHGLCLREVLYTHDRAE
ncbi:MAG: tRNA pseudouridine(38-40) synthase TruA [Simkaniaceae bacterium]|nr:tRNA pseudouridine(38-40) synthase TruA [Simkaniaceae bacterium]